MCPLPRRGFRRHGNRGTDLVGHEDGGYFRCRRTEKHRPVRYYRARGRRPRRSRPHKQPWVQKLAASKPFDVRDLASELPEVVAAIPPAIRSARYKATHARSLSKLQDRIAGHQVWRSGYLTAYLESLPELKSFGGPSHLMNGVANDMTKTLIIFGSRLSG